MPTEIRHVVLAHELWHIRRHDWFWLVAEETVRPRSGFTLRSNGWCRACSDRAKKWSTS